MEGESERPRDASPRPEAVNSPPPLATRPSALLGVVALYSPKHTYDPLFLSNYVTINLLDQIKSTPGVGDATLWGPQDYAMRAWIRTDRLTGLNLTAGEEEKARRDGKLEFEILKNRLEVRHE